MYDIIFLNTEGVPEDASNVNGRASGRGSATMRFEHSILYVERAVGELP